MSFWKKSDDPWDWKDEEERRPRKAPAPPPVPTKFMLARGGLAGI